MDIRFAYRAAVFCGAAVAFGCPASAGVPDAAALSRPAFGTRESAVAPKAGTRLPAKSPLFLEPGTNVNLLVNSSFEMGKVAHRVFSETRYGADAPQARVEVVAGARHGEKCLRVATPPDVRAILVATAPRVGPSTRVAYSVWLKADRPVSVAYHAYAACNDLWGDGKVDWTGTTCAFNVTTEWRRFDAHHVTGAKQGWVCPRLTIPSDCVCWVDAEQLEVSNDGRPSDYRPAAPVEAAFELDRRIFEQDECAGPVTREARLLTFDYEANRMNVENRRFQTSRYGRFALEDEVAGRPALPVEYAVVHPLKPYPGKGLFIGINGGLPTLRPGYSARKNYVPDGAEDDYYKLVRLAGMRLLRIWDGDIWWKTLEPRKGDYFWQPLDHAVDGAGAAGMETMFVLGSGAFLKWKDPERDRSFTNWFVRLNARPAKISGMPQWSTGLELRDADWDDFNRDLVRHAKGRIKYYEIVNEPNLQVADPDYYVHLMRLAYGRVKTEDPSATVVGICSTGDFGGDLGGYIGAVGERGGFRYLDWMSFHPYSGPTDVTPKTAEEQIAAISKLVEKYRPGCPIIEDELYYICDNSAEKRANRGCNWRASNVIRRYVLDFMGGCVASTPLAREQIWHQGPEMTGLDNSYFLGAHHYYPDDRYVVSNAFAHFLEGGRFLRKPTLPDGLNGAEFENARGRKVEVLWAKRATDIRTIDVPAGAVAYDCLGNRLGSGRIDLTEDPVYILK